MAESVIIQNNNLPTREAGLMSATAFQGGGKTFSTLKLIERYRQLHPNRKVLIFDVNNEYRQDSQVFKQCFANGTNLTIKVLGPTVADVQRFTAHSICEVRRVLAIDPKTGNQMTGDEMKETLANIIQNFYKGLLILEDFNTYLTDVRHMQEILGSIIRLRHKDLDTMVHFQSLSALDTRFWQNMKLIRMHWQTDDIERYRSRIPNFKLIKIAYLLIDYYHYDKNDRFFYCWIHTQSNKISGMFSRKDFMLALIRYFKTDGTELKETMKMMGLKNNNTEPAMKHLCNKAFAMYGNEW